MPKKILTALIFFLLMLISAGCAPECTAEEIASFTPILISPANGSEVSYDSPITFDWTHNESCKPKDYQILIDPLNYYYVEGDETSFSYGLGFSPGTQYQWFIRGSAKDDNNQSKLGPKSAVWTFTTDGMCTSASELVAPVLTEPAFGEWLGEGKGPGPGFVRIKWSYPGDCFPDGFQYQVAADPEFENIIMSGQSDWDQYYDEYIYVPRCARVYWRVKARIGNQYGDYSEASRFTYASISSCFQNQESVDAALIKGRVFADICLLTKPWIPEDDVVLPPCTSSSFGIHGDGNQSRGAEGDPGIEDVIVELGAGPCPSTGLDTFHTLKNGLYYFMVQAPGEYCVSASKITNPSLENGIWTEPLTDEDVTQQTLTFGPTDTEMHQNFGWDDNNYIQVEFIPEFITKCRSGYGMDYPEELYLEKGIPVPLIARNNENTWFLTRLGCWVYSEQGFDLPIGPKPLPPPAPIPVDIPDDGGEEEGLPDCDEFTGPNDCPSDHCKWEPDDLGLGTCTDK